MPIPFHPLTEHAVIALFVQPQSVVQIHTFHQTKKNLQQNGQGGTVFADETFEPVKLLSAME